MSSLLAWVLALSFAQQSIDLDTVHPANDAGPPEKVEQRGTEAASDRSISNVRQPTVTVYLPPPATATGQAILICPGGGYEHLAIDKEGHDVARWLTHLGVAGVVLKYRLPGQTQMRAAGGELHAVAKAAHVAVEDAEAAMRLVRANATRWHVRPDAVGMMGFSAGGNLASLLGMLAAPAAKPDFLILAYPGIPKTLEVTSATPRSFLVQADDDKLSAGENSARFYQALRQAGVPAELHVYASGGHGFGVRKNGKASDAWTDALAAWLRTPVVRR